MIKLSEEQQKMVDLAKAGRNILVDACIGSGKTASIQALCNEMSDKHILYLTYNKLLKLDAQEKIKNDNVLVTNYHGYAYAILKENKINCGINELIQKFIELKPKDRRSYDVLILDEYQDIEQEIAEMLKIIKERNSGLQIVAVGDMAQKIYDKTTLNVPVFIDEFLGEYEKVNYTQSFRMPKDYGKRLGDIWNKEINGVNTDCKIEYMSQSEVIEFLATKEPKDILCLGQLTGGKMVETLNILEDNYPEKFNKKTMWMKIREGEGGTTSPDKNTGIFTSFDGSKGLERDICVIFDFTDSYWRMRSSKAEVKYDILRNIFLVGASRGKKKIIFVEDTEAIVEDETLKQRYESSHDYDDPFTPSDMFDFKYIEDVEECFKALEIHKLQVEDKKPILIKEHDELIDLSPCIGMYQEAMYFKNYDTVSQMKYEQDTHKDKILKIDKSKEIEEHILDLVAFDTGQERYKTQVKIPFIEQEDKEKLFDRLATRLKREEEVQKSVDLYFKAKDKVCKIAGLCDVLKDNVVWELKFVSELSHPMFLQCAMYIIMFGIKKGIIWNTRKNDMYEITIPDKKKFMDLVVKCITKGYATECIIATKEEREKFEKEFKSEVAKIKQERKDKMFGNTAWKNDAPSEKQLDLIERIEDELDVEFKGKTKGEASAFISQWIGEL